MGEASKTLGAQAVVVGGGMGGMMAAQVLSKFFDQVTILEKDTLPIEAEPRMGVPQGAHAHALLVQGRRNLERLFPGFTGELIDRGAVAYRAGLDDKIYDHGWMPARYLGLTIISMSRPLLEGLVRDFVRRNPKIVIREQVKATGWAFEDGRVVGVKLDADDGEEVVRADLAVDSSGRSSESQHWIEVGGYGPVEETVINIGSGYATAIFEKPPEFDAFEKSIIINNEPPSTRGAFIFSLEHNRFICSMTGRFGDAPTAKEEDYFERAKSLKGPQVHDWISRSTRLTPIRVYRAPKSRWRRFDKLERFPEGLLPIADAVAHVNPFRGQGMTLASEQARILEGVLAEKAEGADGPLAKPYFERIHAFTKGVWEGLETLEWSYPDVTGDRPADIDQRIAFGKVVGRLFKEDAEAQRILVEISNLVRPGSDFVACGVLDKAMALMQQMSPPSAEPVEA